MPGGAGPDGRATAGVRVGCVAPLPCAVTGAGRVRVAPAARIFTGATVRGTTDNGGLGGTRRCAHGEPSRPRMMRWRSHPRAMKRVQALTTGRDGGCGPSAPAARAQDGHHPIGVSSAQAPPSHRAIFISLGQETAMGPAAVWPTTVLAYRRTDSFRMDSRRRFRVPWVVALAYRGGVPVGVSIRSVDRSDGGGETSVFACDGGLGLPGCSCACGLLWATARLGGDNQRT